MEAGQIMMVPTATDVRLPVAMEATQPNADGSSSPGGFGALLAQSMETDGNQQEAVATGETMAADAADGSQEQPAGSDLLQVAVLNLLLASQFGAFQMNAPVQQHEPVNVDLAAEEVSTTPVEGKRSNASVESLLGDAETALPEIKTRQGELVQKNTEAFVTADTDQEVRDSNLEATSVERPAGASKEQHAPQQVPMESRVSSDSATTSAISHVKISEEQLASQTTGFSSGTAAATPLTSQTGTVVPQQTVIRTTATVQNEEALSRIDKSPEKQEAMQAAASKVLVKDGSQPERQVAAEAQALPQELTTGTKTAATAVSQPFRFAQSTDVVVAASDAGSQNNLSSNSEQQGSQLAPKLASQMVVTTDVALPSQIAEQPSVALRSSELQMINPQMGQQTVEALDELVTEPVRIAVPEQVGRQVTERLAAHEIKQGNDQISFKLSPENLGNLQLNMRMEDQRLKLEIVAENREVRNALLLQADDLKETLAKQNIQMESFDVTTGTNGNNSQQSRDWRQMSAEQRQQQPQYAGRTGNASSGFETPVRYFAKQYQSTIDVRF